MSHLKSVCVFCGSKAGQSPEYALAAADLGRALADAGIHLVFGGGHVGLMGILADEVLARGGEVTGVIPKSLQERELAHSQVSDMRIVDSMHSRKALMAELSEAFIALPGGLGTFEELCEILTWAQLGFHSKPVALFNVNGYYDHLLKLINHAIAEGFMSNDQRESLIAANSVSELMKRLLTSPLGKSDPAAIREQT